MKEWDSSRLIDSTSGWFAQRKSDFDSEHIYFHNEYLKPRTRPLLLSECGGYAYPVKGHLYHPKKSMGYGTAASPKELTDKMLQMYWDMVFPSVGDGMCGVVYTRRGRNWKKGRGPDAALGGPQAMAAPPAAAAAEASGSSRPPAEASG